MKHSPRKTVKLWIAEHSGDLSCPVRSEIKKYYGIPILYPSVGSTDNRLYKLVRNPCVIGFLYRRKHVITFFSLTRYKSVVGDFHSVPSLVAVHGIVSSDDRGHLSDAELPRLFYKLIDISVPRCGRGISSIHKAVYKHLLNTLPLRKLQKTIKMCVVRMNTTIREETVEMQGFVCRLHMLTRGLQLLVLKKCAVLYLLCDPGKILIYDPTGSHVQMTDLGISHLSFGKSDSHPTGISLNKRITLHQHVNIRSIRSHDGVPLLIFREAKAVKYHQYYRFFHHQILKYYL